MKKAAIIVCAAIYVIAIIVVAFLGYQAEIHNPPVYADDIVLVQPVPYERVENGTVIYTINEKADANADEGVAHTYDVHIKEFEFFYYVMGAKMQIEAKPISFKVDEETGVQKEPNEKNLNYFVSDEKLEVDSKGNFTFKVFEDDGSFDCLIMTKDGSNITVSLHIHW